MIHRSSLKARLYMTIFATSFDISFDILQLCFNDLYGHILYALTQFSVNLLMIIMYFFLFCESSVSSS